MNEINKKDTLFVIGSGASLSKIDMTKLSDFDTIGMNRQYIAFTDWGFQPTYFLVIDPQLVATIHKDIEKLVGGGIKKFFIMNGGDITKRLKSQYGDKIVTLSETLADEKLRKGGELENRPMSFVGNAGACAVEIGLQLGYKRVVLLGIDAHYIKDKKLNYFNPDYVDVGTFVEGVNYGPPNADSGTKYWKMFSQQQKSIPNFDIISSSPNSAVNEFLEYVEFDDLIESYKNKPL